MTTKQRKAGSPVQLRSQDQNMLRREIDDCIKRITVEIEKNPKKAARLFEIWLGEKSVTHQKRKAA